MKVKLFLFILFVVFSKVSGITARTFGGADDGVARSIQQTSDGGYIVVGYTWSFGAGSEDFLVIKLDSNGNIQWVRTFGGTEQDYAQPVQQTSDGGYILAGETTAGATHGNCLIIKLDGTGEKQWAKAFGGDTTEYAYSVQQTSDAGYIVAGVRGFCGDGDFLVIKVDSTGDIPGCLLGYVASSTIGNPSLTVTSPTLTTKKPTLTVTSPTLTATNPKVKTFNICNNEVE